ncbi:MAG TPA: hypothetical protein ENL45_01410 [Candidatus Woesearchaeota archaeon]|nr:hypothetical protein [Candidatus Woesearchaeota archaeon]
MKLKPILLIIVILVLASQAYALGIAPSHIDVIFEPGLEKTIQLKVMNNVHKDFDAVIYAEGELAEYITIENPTIKLSKDEDSKIISYKVKLPQSFEKQGLHEAKVVVREIPKETKGGTTITAAVAVVSKLKVMVPYKGKYAEIKLFVTNFKENEESNFAVEVKNLGTQDILEAYAIVNIYDPSNNKVATVTSNKESIESKDNEILIAKWKPNLKSGNYRAVATLMYDNLNTRDEKSFSIGTMFLDINSITVDNFKLGGIAKFDILVENEWNEEVPQVYADTSIGNEKGKIYSTYKTSNVDIPAFGQQEINSFLDTSKLSVGRYKLNVDLNYLSQKAGMIFDIMVEQNKITANLAGRAIIDEESEESPAIIKSIYILIFLIIILIIFNIVIYFRKIRK